MKKRAAKHVHFRQPGEPMFDDQKVDASQIEDRRPKFGTKAILKAAFMQQGWKPAKPPVGGGAGRAAGKPKNKRVPD